MSLPARIDGMHSPVSLLTCCRSDIVPKRSIVVAASLTASSEVALAWTIDNLAREGDAIHVCHVCKVSTCACAIYSAFEWLLRFIYRDTPADRPEQDCCGGDDGAGLAGGTKKCY